MNQNTKKKWNNLKNKIWQFLSKELYLYFILAVIISVVMALIVYRFSNLEVTDVIELSAFSAVVLESLLSALTGFIRKIASNKVEDPSKLTTEYENLVKTYHLSMPQMVKGSEDTPIPVVIEAWTYDKTLCIEDHPEYEYRLPEIVVRYFDQLFSAHKTSNIYNNVNIRINDWGIEDGKYIVRSGRTTYYSSLVTNRAMDFEIETGMTVRQLFECGPFLHPIANSKLSNHIGFNGFVESADGSLAFVYRGKDVSIGKKTWAISIGASLKAKYALNEQYLFTEEGLEYGIIKEIEDELKIPPERLCEIGTQFRKVVIISAYRDLVEGGKPQFFIYAKSSLTEAEISKLFYAGNSDVKKRARKEEHIREKKEIQMETDGSKILWIPKQEIVNDMQILPDRIIYHGTEMIMMPSASACVQMMKEYLIAQTAEKRES